MQISTFSPQSHLPCIVFAYIFIFSIFFLFSISLITLFPFLTAATPAFLACYADHTPSLSAKTQTSSMLTFNKNYWKGLIRRKENGKRKGECKRMGVIEEMPVKENGKTSSLARTCNKCDKVAEIQQKRY